MTVLIYSVMFLVSFGIVSQSDMSYGTGMLTAYLAIILISPLIRVLLMNQEAASKYENGKSGYFMTMVGRGIIWPLLIFKKLAQVMF